MHNCLSEHEWRNYLVNGARKVVFIRRKNAPKKSYIACDIDSESGTIIQYLTYCNGRVSECDAMNFYKEYQAYLKNIWEEN